MNEKINSLCSKVQFLSGAWLKLIAILSMLIDHVNKALIYPNLVSNDGVLTTVTQTSHIKNGLRTLKNQYFNPQNSNHAALCPYFNASCIYFGSL